MNKKNSIDLELSGCRLISCRNFIDKRGKLTAYEFDEILPFEPKRCFLVNDVPSNTNRGEHAHYLCEQALVCVRGSCIVDLYDGINSASVCLSNPETLLYIPPKIWGIQREHSEDANLLVFASHSYDPKDYITSLTEFKNMSIKK